MQRKNEDTYKIFHGMKPVKRQVRRDNQSGWYYLDPRGAENFSDMKEIGVESENSPNPKIKAILDDDMHKNPDDYYVWRTKKDDKVRDSHREREGKVFNWHVPPEGGHPGEDHNCRCWAEAYRPDLMAHLNITPKVDLSGLPQYAANDKTGSVSDAKYVSAENDKVEAQDKNAVAVPVPTPKPEVPAQTTAKKIVPVPARKPLTWQGLAEEMLRRYVERAPEAGLKLAAADYKNGYTTESVWGYPNVGYNKGGEANDGISSQQENRPYIFSPEMRTLLGYRESKNDYGAYNPSGGGIGALGMYQIRKDGLIDTGYLTKDNKWTGKNGIKSIEDFLNNPKVQEIAFDEYMKVQYRYLSHFGETKYVGAEFKGVTSNFKVTDTGLLAAIHRTGIDYMNKFFKNLEKDKDGMYYMDYSKIQNTDLKTKFLWIETRLREFEE